MICPCKDCDKRNSTCHSKCSDFKEWTEEHIRIKEQERKYLDFENSFKKRRKYYGRHKRT